jgi:hypothetical protein
MNNKKRPIYSIKDYQEPEGTEPVRFYALTYADGQVGLLLANSAFGDTAPRMDAPVARLGDTVVRGPYDVKYEEKH